MSDREFDPWATLGVPIGAPPAEIRRAFRRLARRMHPDVSRDRERAHEQFIELRQAYETLMDDRMRAQLERRVLGADTEPLLIIEDFEVALGDAYELLQRGYVQEARETYLELSRDHPGDPRLLELLQAIADVESAGAEAAPATGREARERYRDLWSPEPVGVRWLLVAAAVAVTAGSTLAMRLLDAPAVIGPCSIHEIILACIGSFLVAALLAAAGVLGSFDFELGGSVSSGRHDVPLWLYLGIAGLISALLALVFYTVFAWLQSQWSWRVISFFAGTFVLAAMFWQAHGSALLPALALGANAVLVSALAGWAVGSIFKPGYWWE